ncbi:MAG: RAMP superfamily CRISPR-associated protein [Candidatus Nezhaarchaeales archaeon]
MGLIHHLNPLKCKIIGVLEFKIEAPLSISTGGAEARRAFIRIPGDEGFLIPSSTWKGVFRSISERIAKSMEFKDKLADLAVKSFEEDLKASYRVNKEFCSEVLNVLRGNRSTVIPYSKEELIEIAEQSGFTLEEIGEIMEKGFNTRDNLYRLSESILAFHCPIGRLYGNQLLAGKLRFLDTILRTSDGTKLHERTSVAIDRYSGKVRERAFFILESIIGERVWLRIIADNLTPRANDSRLFALTLRAIKELGLSLGARKSAGMGLLTLSDETSYWYIVDLESDKEGIKIANPFKYAEKKSMEEFLKWLHG